MDIVFWDMRSIKLIIGENVIIVTSATRQTIGKRYGSNTKAKPKK